MNDDSKSIRYIFDVEVLVEGELIFVRSLKATTGSENAEALAKYERDLIKLLHFIRSD